MLHKNFFRPCHPTLHPTAGFGRTFKAIAFDMDSTLISIECIDEIADAGKKAEVAAITEAAMRGEITDFKDSLRRRVALLKGCLLRACRRSASNASRSTLRA